MEAQAKPRRASTEAIFEFLGSVPWWIVIVAIVGLLVGFSVISNFRYLDAIYFIFDFPWDKDPIGEVPIEDGNWRFTPEIGIPLRPGTYKLYAEFNQVKAKAAPEDEEKLTLHTEPDGDSAPSDQLAEGEWASFVEWKIIPKQGLTPQQNWVYATTDDGRAGWALDEGFVQETYKAVGKTELYKIKVPEEAEPGETTPIEGPTDDVVEVETSTPTLGGPVPGGVWVRIYDQYNLKQTLIRMWGANGVMLTLRATVLGFGLALLLGLIAGLMRVTNPSPDLSVNLGRRLLLGLVTATIIVITLQLRAALKDTAPLDWRDLTKLPAHVVELGEALVHTETGPKLGQIVLLFIITEVIFFLGPALLYTISTLYVEVIRGLPMLVIILYAGFVVAPNLRDATGGKIALSRLTGAILGLGFGYGAYLAEVFRAGIQSIHYGQMEAARSLGMSYPQAMRHVILPQAIRVILPPLGNDFIAMLKDSSLISVIALPEILQQGRLWVSRTFRGFEGYNTVALFYVVLTLLLSLLVRFIERKAALPGRSVD
jgi:His/Glu/Gln/Arg/opine family amino acid ABC transporter permease subunit